LIPKGAFKTKLIKISEEYYDGSNQCVDRWVFPLSDSQVLSP